eukprot:1698020-Prymnesium_polylepis.1
MFSEKTDAKFGHICIGILLVGIAAVATGDAFLHFLSAEVWTLANVGFWFALELSWVYRFDAKDNLKPALMIFVGIIAYSIFWGAVGLKAIPAVFGIPFFPVPYCPPFLVYAYFLLMTSTGKNIAKNIPVPELILASAYRYVMEIPWGMMVEVGDLPCAIANPLYTCKQPYTLELFGGIEFTTGLAFDGLPSMIIAPALAAFAAYKGLPNKVLVAYQLFGMTTLTSAIILIVTNFPQPNILAFWDAKADTGAFMGLPGVIQAYFGSMLGWIINIIAFRKGLGYI